MTWKKERGRGACTPVKKVFEKVMSELFVGILIASVLIGILAVIPEEVGAETWSIETVDSDVYVGRYTSIALDSNGYPRISYFDDTNMDLKYVKWTGTGWSIETVDSDGYVGRYTSIALDSNGYPHISYFDDINQDLKYVKWTGTGWSIETIDSDDEVGRFTSIVLDNNGYPHISYFDDINKDLKYVKWNGTGWSSETVDSKGHVGWYTSIALDSNDYPHISYFDDSNQALKYVKRTGTGWSSETVDSDGDVGKFTSIVLDSSNYPHISYFDDINKDLKYAKWTGTEWSIETVDSDGDVGRYTSIVLDSNDYPHISYLDYTNRDFKYAKLMPDVQSSPQNLSAVAGDKYVDLSWNPPPSDGGSAITEYKIYRGTSSGGEGYLDSVSTTSYKDTTVTNGQTYYYHVTAINVAGESSPSKEVPAEPRGPPGSPQNLRAAAGDDYVKMVWIAPSDVGGSGITNYNIYRGTTPGGETLLKTVGNVLIYTDSDVTSNQKYYYQVSAVNSVGEGEKSNELDARLISTPTLTPPTTSIATATFTTAPTSKPTLTPPTTSIATATFTTAPTSKPTQAPTTPTPKLTPTPKQPETGNISISTNIESAPFIISGPDTYSGSGTSWSKEDAPAGTYTIAYGEVSGYNTPPHETKTLSAGGLIKFTGKYEPQPQNEWWKRLEVIASIIFTISVIAGILAGILKLFIRKRE